MSLEIGYSLLTGTAVKSIAVLGVAGFVSLALRGRSAAARHIAWNGAFAALIALPVLSLALPEWRAPAASILSADTILFRTGAVSPGHASNPALRAAIPAAPAPTHSGIPLNWPAAVMLVWAAGAGLSALRVAAGCIALARIRRGARRLHESELQGLRRSLGIAHPVDLLEAAPATMPVTFGLLKPAILLPADAAWWSDERRRAVLLHELAHIRRGDLAAQFLARAALCLYWWNPLVWAAARAARSQRERAADDLVLGAGIGAADYAQHLLELARSLHSSRLFAAAALAMARPTQLEGRLRAILDSGRRRTFTSRISLLATAAVATVLVAPLAVIHAQDSQPATQSTATAGDLEASDRAAQDAMSQGDIDAAHHLYQQSLILRGKQFGPQSKPYGIGWSHLGDTARIMDHAEAVADYTQAEALLQGDPEAATALTYLGIDAIDKEHYEDALRFLERAQTAGASSRDAATATLWMAIVRDREGQYEAADKLFRQAIWQRHGYPNTGNSRADQLVYAAFLTRQGRESEADAVRKQAASEASHHPMEVRSGVFKVGGDVRAPKVVFTEDPKYPVEGKIAKLQGTVVLQVEIGPDGVPQHITLLRGVGFGLEEAAMNAVHHWRFAPAQKDGQPVAVASTLEVNFTLMD